MEYIETAVNRVAEAAAWALARVGDFIVPMWNRLLLTNDMYIILGPPLWLIVALICLYVSFTRAANGVGRGAKRLEKALDGGDRSDISLYYSLAWKLFYYPMVAYFFLMYSPFDIESTLRAQETVFYRFDELTDGFKVVVVFLMLRFIGVVASDVLRLRLLSLIKFMLYTVSCAIIGAYIHGILLALSQAGEGNLIFALISVIANFIFSTMPMVYFYIAMLMPLYELVMPLLTPFALIFGLVVARARRDMNFRDWVFNNHFFAWIYLFVDR